MKTLRNCVVIFAVLMCIQVLACPPNTGPNEAADKQDAATSAGVLADVSFTTADTENTNANIAYVDAEEMSITYEMCNQSSSLAVDSKLSSASDEHFNGDFEYTRGNEDLTGGDAAWSAGDAFLVTGDWCEAWDAFDEAASRYADAIESFNDAHTHYINAIGYYEDAITLMQADCDE